jgi:branched-chain amino acid transport system permease protein
VRDRSKEIVTLIALLIPISFVGIGGYLQEVMGYVLLFVIQGYVAWFLYFRSGQPFFGYSVTMAIGAYGTIVMTVQYQWPILVSMLVGTVLASLVSVGMFFATSRARGFYVTIASFLLAILFPKLMEAMYQITGGRSGLYFGGLEDWTGRNVLYIIIVLMATIIVGAIFVLMRTKTGAILTLISENDDLTQTVGINTFKYKALSYVIAGFISGLGGGLYVNYTGFISSVDVDVFTTVYIFFIPLLGGRSVCYGPLIGALVVILAPELAAPVERYLLIILGVIFILVTVLLPAGVGPSLENLFRKIFGKTEKKAVAAMAQREISL